MYIQAETTRRRVQSTWMTTEETRYRSAIRSLNADGGRTRFSIRESLALRTLALRTLALHRTLAPYTEHLHPNS